MRVYTDEEAGGLMNFSINVYPVIYFYYSVRSYVRTIFVQWKMENFYKKMYQIRRPLGLAFVIYFWWLGELLLLYI